MFYKFNEANVLRTATFFPVKNGKVLKRSQHRIPSEPNKYFCFIEDKQVKFSYGTINGKVLMDQKGVMFWAPKGDFGDTFGTRAFFIEINLTY